MQYHLLTISGMTTYLNEQIFDVIYNSITVTVSRWLLTSEVSRLYFFAFIQRLCIVMLLTISGMTIYLGELISCVICNGAVPRMKLEGIQSQRNSPKLYYNLNQ